MSFSRPYCRQPLCARLAELVRTNSQDEVIARAANLIVGRAAYESCIEI